VQDAQRAGPSSPASRGSQACPQRRHRQSPGGSPGIHMSRVSAFPQDGQRLSFTERRRWSIQVCPQEQRAQERARKAGISLQL